MPSSLKNLPAWSKSRIVLLPITAYICASYRDRCDLQTDPASDLT
jgi:hypothetical protein